ncbi:hypothetical protein [uncultured Ruminococcus sp.]|nr:hypothetical protein [uncultured Ruminococcus sp.]
MFGKKTERRRDAADVSFSEILMLMMRTAGILLIAGVFYEL